MLKNEVTKIKTRTEVKVKENTFTIHV